MSLETYSSADDLYLARGREVNLRRPLLTGDVFKEVEIPGVGDEELAVLCAHPCSMRGLHAQLADRVLVGAVRDHAPVRREEWMKGFFDRMPLPELLASGELHVAHLDLVGRARTKDLGVGRRVACLSNFGINLLQQRFVWHLTRCAVETFKFHEACSHALAEVDLLEDWNDILCEAGLAEPDALTRFDSFIRDRREGGRTRQDDLRDPQRRASVRSACRTEALRIASEVRSSD